MASVPGAHRHLVPASEGFLFGEEPPEPWPRPLEIDYLHLESLQLLEQNGGYGNAVPSRGPPHLGGSSSGGYSGGLALAEYDQPYGGLLDILRGGTERLFTNIKDTSSKVIQSVAK